MRNRSWLLGLVVFAIALAIGAFAASGVAYVLDSVLPPFTRGRRYAPEFVPVAIL